MRTPNIAFALSILSLIVLQPAFAAEDYREQGILIGGNEFKDVNGLRLGSATVKSVFSTEGTYDSNVYLTPDDARQDYFFTLAPKVLLDVPLGIKARHLIQMMYKGEGGLFSTQTKQNYMNHEGAGNVNLTLPFGYLNVNDDFRDTTSRSGTEFTTRVKRIENRASTTMGVEINKVTLEAGYSHFLENYRETLFKTLDYYQNVFKGTVFYQLFPKTKALMDYAFGLIDYPRNKDRSGHYNQVTAGLKGQLTGKTTGIVKFGFQTRNYKAGKGYNGYVAELGLVTQLTERTEVTIKYNTSPVESTFGGNNYYTTNTMSAGLDQKLIGNFRLLLHSDVSRNHYPLSDVTTGERRRDWLFTEGAELQYKIKDWSKLRLSYDFKRRSSNNHSQSYTNHQFTTGIDFFF